MSTNRNSNFNKNIKTNSESKEKSTIKSKKSCANGDSLSMDQFKKLLKVCGPCKITITEQSCEKDDP